MDLLLPLCISLATLGLVVAIILWLRNRRSRATQALGFAVLPVGLYLTGLLGLVIDAVAALGRWASSLIFNPAVWAGFGLLGLAIVLWVVGGIIARRSPRPSRTDQTPVTSGDRRPAVTKSSPPATAAAPDDGFDEIEELLRKRGIE